MAHSLLATLLLACLAVALSAEPVPAMGAKGTVLLQREVKTRAGLAEEEIAEEKGQQRDSYPGSLETVLLMGFATGLLLWRPSKDVKAAKFVASELAVSPELKECQERDACNNSAAHAGVNDEKAPRLLGRVVSGTVAKDAKQPEDKRELASGEPPRSVHEALIAAIEDGDAVLVQALLEEGASANEAAACGTTPLHVAAARRSGGVEVCELLLEHGADLSAVDAKGLTPLMVAANAGRESTCELLYEHGGDAGGASDQELPPLLCAIMIRKIMAGGPAPSMED